MSASAMPPVGPPEDCAQCVQHEVTVRRIKNRLVTATQSFIGAGQAGLAGTGVWLFVGGQPAAAAAAAGLTALGFPVIKGLSKLRPRRRN